MLCIAGISCAFSSRGKLKSEGEGRETGAKGMDEWKEGRKKENVESVQLFFFFLKTMTTFHTYFWKTFCRIVILKEPSNLLSTIQINIEKTLGKKLKNFGKDIEKTGYRKETTLLKFSLLALRVSCENAGALSSDNIMHGGHSLWKFIFRLDELLKWPSKTFV